MNETEDLQVPLTRRIGRYVADVQYGKALREVLTGRESRSVVTLLCHLFTIAIEESHVDQFGPTTPLDS